MPKLTETTNDKVKQKKGGNGPTPLRIVEAHEPLKDETPPSIPMTPSTPIPAPQFIIPQMPFMTATPIPGPIPVAEPQPIKVALVGTAPSSRMLAPFNDPSWTIWACSPGNQNILPRVDAWFEIHSNLLWPEYKHYGEPYVAWLKQQKFPVYMQDKSLVPNAIPFPKNDMVKEFGGDFFTSSFTWMMALAIAKGAKEIALYGIDMASREEYIVQRQGFYFFRYIARQKGIKVFAPYESDIMMSPGLYGYSDGTPFGRKLHARKKEISDRIMPLRQQLQQIDKQITYLEGALEDNDYCLSIWIGAQDNSSEVNQ